MKMHIILFCFLIAASTLHAQNVGIGIINPVFKLDVRDGSINVDSVYGLIL